MSDPRTEHVCALRYPQSDWSIPWPGREAMAPLPNPSISRWTFDLRAAAFYKTAPRCDCGGDLR